MYLTIVHWNSSNTLNCCKFFGIQFHVSYCSAVGTAYTTAWCLLLSIDTFAS